MLALFIIFLICFPTTYLSMDSLDNTKKEVIEKPIIQFRPEKIVVKSINDRFIVENIQFLNRGIGTLTIESIQASCRCASATVLSNNIESLCIGKIRLSINIEDVEGKVFEFYINSNAKNSPHTYKVILDLDSSNIKNYLKSD